MCMGGRTLARIMEGKRDIKNMTETKEGGLQTMLCAQSEENLRGYGLIPSLHGGCMCDQLIQVEQPPSEVQNISKFNSLGSDVMLQIRRVEIKMKVH